MEKLKNIIMLLASFHMSCSCFAAASSSQSLSERIEFGFLSVLDTPASVGDLLGNIEKYLEAQDQVVGDETLERVKHLYGRLNNLKEVVDFQREDTNIHAPKHAELIACYGDFLKRNDVRDKRLKQKESDYRNLQDAIKESSSTKPFSAAIMHQMLEPAVTQAFFEEQMKTEEDLSEFGKLFGGLACAYIPGAYSYLRMIYDARCDHKKCYEISNRIFQQLEEGRMVIMPLFWHLPNSGHYASFLLKKEGDFLEVYVCNKGAGGYPDASTSLWQGPYEETKVKETLFQMATLIQTEKAKGYLEKEEFLGSFFSVIPERIPYLKNPQQTVGNCYFANQVEEPFQVFFKRLTTGYSREDLEVRSRFVEPIMEGFNNHLSSQKNIEVDLRLIKDRRELDKVPLIICRTIKTVKAGSSLREFLRGHEIKGLDSTLSDFRVQVVVGDKDERVETTANLDSSLLSFLQLVEEENKKYYVRCYLFKKEQ